MREKCVTPRFLLPLDIDIDLPVAALSLVLRNLDVREERYEARRMLKQPLQLLPSSILHLCKLLSLRPKSAGITHQRGKL